MLEQAGIATVCVFIRAFRHQAYLLKPPRTLITQHILGRTVGAPGDVERQRRVVGAALRLLETAHSPGAVEELHESYRSAAALTRRPAAE